MRAREVDLRDLAACVTVEAVRVNQVLVYEVPDDVVCAINADSDGRMQTFEPPNQELRELTLSNPTLGGSL